MTEMKSSFLTGFTPENYYAKAGAFRGSLPSGFMVSVLFRDLKPYIVEVEPEAGLLVTSVVRPLCGNFRCFNSIDDYRGWSLRLVSDFELAQYTMELLYGDSAKAPVDETLFTLTSGAISQRTLLVHIFFGVLSESQGKGLPQIFFFVNGVPIGDPIDIENGFTPADADNPFQLGACYVEAVDTIFAAPSTGIAGFAHFDTIPQNSTNDDNAIVEMAAFVAAHWDAVQATEDMTATGQTAHDQALLDSITTLYSTRRGLPDVDDGAELTWSPSVGTTVLERVGTEELSVEANKPRFWSGNADLPAPPVPP